MTVSQELTRLLGVAIFASGVSRLCDLRFPALGEQVHDTARTSDPDSNSTLLQRHKRAGGLLVSPVAVLGKVADIAFEELEGSL